MEKEILTWEQLNNLKFKHIKCDDLCALLAGAYVLGVQPKVEKRQTYGIALYIKTMGGQYYCIDIDAPTIDEGVYPLGFIAAEV